MKNLERTGGQTAYSALGIIQSRGLTNLDRCLDDEVLVEISSADHTSLIETAAVDTHFIRTFG